MAQPNGVMCGSGCPHCSNRVPLTKEVVNERIADRGIELVGGYVSGRHKSEFRCSEGHTWVAKPNGVMSGKGCPYCSGRAGVTKQVVNERIADRGIELVGEYANVKHKSEFRCSEGHTWMATSDSVMRGSGCPYCSNRAPLTKQVVNERIADRGLELVGEYVNAKHKSEFRCSEGHTWLATPGDVMRGTGCPKCYRGTGSAILYYLRVESERYGTTYKIGITSKSVEQRFCGKDLERITTLKTWDYDDWDSAYDMEQRVLKDFASHRITTDDLLVRAGNTEMFDMDVLQLDADCAVTYDVTTQQEKHDVPICRPSGVRPEPAALRQKAFHFEWS